MFKALVKMKKSDTSLTHMLIRRSKIYLFIVIGLRAIGMVIIGILIMWSYDLSQSLQRSNNVIQFIYGGLVIASIMIVFATFIAHVIRYFYKILIITKDRIVIIQFGIFFTEEIDTTELYRIQSIQTHQSGIRKTIFNFGDIEFDIQNSGDNKVVPMLGHPKMVAMHIEKLKEETIKSRRRHDNAKEDTTEINQ